mgnify:CR=1 FL=1
MMRILYFDEYELKAMTLMTLLRLQGLTFDKATHFIEDTKQYAFVFKEDCEDVVRDILSLSNPQFKPSFETLNI